MNQPTLRPSPTLVGLYQYQKIEEQIPSSTLWVTKEEWLFIAAFDSFYEANRKADRLTKKDPNIRLRFVEYILRLKELR